jgi:hypothetical protein
MFIGLCINLHCNHAFPCLLDRNVRAEGLYKVMGMVIQACLLVRLKTVETISQMEKVA